MKFTTPNKRELAYIGLYIPTSYILSGVRQNQSTKRRVISTAIGATTMLATASLGVYRK